MYTFDSRVRYSEVDEQGRITAMAILDYFQDCSNFQSEDLGIGIEYLKEKQLAWVLVSWQIQVERYPMQGEQIRIGTWPYDFKGFYGYRNFLMTDCQGNPLAYANSLWVLLDLKSGRPAKIPQEMGEAYEIEASYPMERLSRKIGIPQEMEAREPFRVQKFHLDTNQHVNNGKYILMAQEYLPEGFSIGKLRAEYKKSAVYNDMIYPSVKVEEEKVTVALSDEQQVVYAMIELERKND